jgi:glycosyltransferase involved in cell wall biosynthesis
MNIYIDISPLESGHKVRGVGFYLSRLKAALETYFPQHSYHFFTDSLPQTQDVVHVPYFDPFFLSLPFNKPKKTVVTVHDLTPLVFPELFPIGIKGRIKWEVQKRALKGVNHIITDSEASKKDIIRLAGIKGDNISVVYLAAGEEFKKIRNSKFEIRNLREKYRLPEKFALYVGDVTPNKNLLSLIDAIIDTQIPLVMVGKALTDTRYDHTNPWNRDQILVQKKIKEYPNLFYPLGFVQTEDLVTLYNIAILAVVPSLYEGFGLPILEAMQCGCPVVTTQGGSLPEVAGDASEVADGFDKNALANSIQNVWENEELQQTLKQKGLVQAKKFSWKNTAEQTLHVYEKMA